MKICRSLICSLSLGSLVVSALAAPTSELPADFPGVYELIRTNLSGVQANELDAAALEGLAKRFPGQILISTNSPTGTTPPLSQGIASTKVFDDAYGYVRVGSIESGLAEELKTTWKNLQSTNSLKGLVLDLRFAQGNDFAAVAKVADVFLREEKPLLNLPTEAFRSEKKSEAIAVPLSVLVNPQTAGAAEALAAVLRETASALLIGQTTAGRSGIYRSFPLADGRQLQVATAVVTLGSGQSLPVSGVQPDITVQTIPTDENRFLEDPFYKSAEVLAAEEAEKAAAATDNPRINEAELVRRSREGLPNQATETVKIPEIEVPVVRDPVLARGLDLLKGLAMVREFRRE